MKKDKLVKTILVCDFILLIFAWVIINLEGLLPTIISFSSVGSWILFFWSLMSIVIFFAFISLIIGIKKLRIFLNIAKIWFLIFYFIFNMITVSLIEEGSIKREIREEESIKKNEVIENTNFEEWEGFEFKTE